MCCRTKEEMVSNLGTIARSGTAAFVEAAKKDGKGDAVGHLIGTFGVGAYSVFMVADKVDIYSRSYDPNSVAHVWSSDGSGTYNIAEAAGVHRGTKIVIQLKPTCAQFASPKTVRETIAKYSNFVQVQHVCLFCLFVVFLQL